jgi:S1-C subfamily serine protease
MRTVALASAVCLAAGIVTAQEQAAQGTVLIRVSGDITAVLSDESGTVRRQVEIPDVEFGAGSGMIVSRFGYVLTNSHVIAAGERQGRIKGVPVTLTLKVDRIQVSLPPESKSSRPAGRFDASIVASDPELDLAILSIPGNDFPYVAFGDSDALETGQPVSVIGYPLGDALDVGRAPAEEHTAPTVGTGIVSSLRDDARGALRYIQTSAPLNRGNSGGPLLDRTGFAAGVVQMKVSAAEGIAFAIPINLAKEFLARSGVDAFLPATRLTAGHLYDAREKLMRVQALHGFGDEERSRLGVDSGSTLPGVLLRIDRIATTWSLEQLEDALRLGQAFGQYPSTPNGTPRRDERVLRGQATGRAGGSPFRMLYSIVDLGEEKVVARYVGGAEQVAFNESVLAASLASLDAAPMLGGTPAGTPAGWTRVSPVRPADIVTVVPAGWVLDHGAPVPCAGVAAPRASMLISPRQDFTLTFRVGQHEGDIDPRQAASRCAAGRGSSKEGEYRYEYSHFGVRFTVEGRFVAVDARVLQIEMAGPAEKIAGARQLFSQWVAELLPSKTAGPDSPR